MKNIITTITKGTMAGSVFFGHAELTIAAHERVKFTVAKFLKEGTEHEFRAISKARAGWNTIFDFKCKAEHLWGHIGKDTQCVQVKVMFKNSDPQWHHVYITKGGKWQTVDVLLLDICTVGDIHQSAPKMACYDEWKRTNATHWDCLAFVMNKKRANKQAA